MILGLGSDICNIDRIARSYERFGKRFINRCYGENEQKEMMPITDPRQLASALAKRFAAKEAFTKALGTGFRNGICWAEIEALHQENGKPYIKLSGSALSISSSIGINKVWVALSDDYPFAQAVVIVEN